MNVEMDSDSIQVVIRVKPNPSGSFLGYDQSSISLGKSKFSFDHVFLPDATQYDVYHLTGSKQIEHTLEGYNSCLFVYGQTGSGKTHTMIGNNNGIVQQSLYHLFGKMAKNPENEYSITCSYFQIYNQQLFDLLDPNKEKKLAVREDIKKGVFVEGLTEEGVDSAERAIVLLNQGVRTRHVGETLMNRESSRSHAIFSLSVQSKQIENGNSIMKKSKIHFVDLAGSERQKSTAALGERLKEASNINKSLTTLGMVINCLSGEKSKAHVPFRDSKLTFVLRDSLSGNSKTFLIATIADSQNSLQETLSTLKFAQRAKLVKLSASINQQSLSLNVEVLKSEIRRLKDELARVKEQLQQEKEKKSSTSCNKIIVNSYSQSMESLNEKINSLVDMIPKLLQKDSPPESSVEEYIRSNNQMLSDMSESLSKFIALKNEVRMKASLQKLRMEDLTPYKVSLGKLNLRKDLNAEGKEGMEIQRVMREKKEFEERVYALLREQEEMRKQVDTVFEEKTNQQNILMERMRSTENKVFELEETNTNLLLELEMVRQKLTVSEQNGRECQEQIFSEGRVISEYEHKLNSSGMFIETLSREMEELHYSISNSARKHRNEMEDTKEILNMKEMELEELQKRYQIHMLQWEQERKGNEEERLELQQSSVGVMKRLEEEMRRNDEMEARNIQLESMGEEKGRVILGLEERVRECEKRGQDMAVVYEERIDGILEEGRRKDEEILSFQAQLITSNNRVVALTRSEEEMNHLFQRLQESSNQEISTLKVKVSQLESLHQNQLLDLQRVHESDREQLIAAYNELSGEINNLREKCNDLTAENYKIKSTRTPLQPDTSQIDSKLQYYQEKFNFMKVEYAKSVETVRLLKQREIMIKEENMKLGETISSLQLELELDHSQEHTGVTPGKKQKQQKSFERKQSKLTATPKEKERSREKENQKSDRNSSAPSITPESLSFLKEMISRLEVETGQSTCTDRGSKCGDDLQDLLKCLESTIRKKEGKMKKEMEKEARLKSQNHLILKQNLYLKEKIRNIENPSYLTITPTKKLKLN